MLPALRPKLEDGDDDDLRGTVAIFDIKDLCDVEYDALSYCWGAEEATKSVTLNGGVLRSASSSGQRATGRGSSGPTLCASTIATAPTSLAFDTLRRFAASDGTPDGSATATVLHMAG